VRALRADASSILERGHSHNDSARLKIGPFFAKKPLWGVLLNN
jgi:hypothetical protein